MVRLAQRELWKSKSIYNDLKSKYLIKVAKLDTKLHSVLQGNKTVTFEVIFPRG